MDYNINKKINISDTNAKVLSNFPFQALCISSGGMNGIYYLGILDYHYERNNLSFITHYSGTSIGAFICVLLIIGYTPKEIFIHICKDDILSSFSDFSFQNLIQYHGLFKIDILKTYLENMILKKLSFIPTLNELFLEFNKTFYCSSYNLTNQDDGITYFSHLSHPNMLISDAVICSCSIPFVFSKNKVNNNTYIDGAIFDPTPIKILLQHFDSDMYPYILTLKYKQNKQNIDQDTFINYANQVMSSIIDLRTNDLCRATHLIEIESNIVSIMFNIETPTKIKLFLEGKQYAISKYKLKEKID